MLAYTLRRIAGLIPTLFVLATLSFFIIRLAPGGPFDQEQALPPAIRANLEAAYGFDRPLIVQYARYLAGVAQGDLGPSLRYKDFTVTELIARGLPLSLTIGLAAAVLAFLTGVPLGAYAAWRANSVADHAIMSFSMMGVVLPGFVVGPLLALMFGIYWPIFRVGGYEPGELSFLVLPVITLALPVSAYIARLMRNSLRRGPARELHSHRARQGAPGRRRVPAACVASGAGSRGQLPRSRRGIRGHGFTGGRIGVWPARVWPLPGPGRSRSRLPAGHGNDPGLRRVDAGVQSHRGPALRLDGSARAPRMSPI